MSILDDPQRRTYSFGDLPQPEQLREEREEKFKRLIYEKLIKPEEEAAERLRYHTSGQYYEDTINRTIEEVRNEGLPVIEKSPEQIRQEVAKLVRKNIATAWQQVSDRTHDRTLDLGKAIQASREFEKSPWYIQQRQSAEKIEQGDLSEATSALNEYIRGRAGYISMGGGVDAEDVKRKRQEFAQQLHDLQTLQAHADNLKK